MAFSSASRRHTAERPRALQYADVMIRRGREEESKKDLASALNCYLLGYRHQMSWLESIARGGSPASGAAEEEAEDMVSVRERLDERRALGDHTNRACSAGGARQKPGGAAAARGVPRRRPPLPPATPATPAVDRAVEASYEADSARFLDEYSFYYANTEAARAAAQQPADDASAPRETRGAPPAPGRTTQRGAGRCSPAAVAAEFSGVDARLGAALRRRARVPSAAVAEAASRRRALAAASKARPAWRAPSKAPVVPSKPTPLAKHPYRSSAARADADGAPRAPEALDAHVGDVAASPIQKLRPAAAADAGAPAELQALLEQKELQISMLTKQLEAAGCAAITEMVPLDEARRRLQFAIQTMMGDGEARQADSRRQLSEAEAEAEFEKWDQFIAHHPEHIEAEKRKVADWDEANAQKCADACAITLSFVPADVLAAGTSKDALVAAGLAPIMAKHVYDTSALWLLRADAEFISKVHDADLRAKYEFSQLDLTELRALWHRVKPVSFENDANKRKAGWREGLIQRLKADTDNATLSGNRLRHKAYTDAPLGPFDPEAPIIAVKTASAAVEAIEVAEVADDNAEAEERAFSKRMTAEDALRLRELGGMLAEDSAENTVVLHDETFGDCGADSPAAPESPDADATPDAPAPRRTLDLAATLANAGLATPRAAAAPASVVSMAKASLRRTSSGFSADDEPRAVRPPKEHPFRTRATPETAQPRDLMTELKASLRRRNSVDAADDEAAPSPVSKPVLPAPHRAARPLAPPGMSFLDEMKQKAEARAKRAAAAADAE
ncbi:hypothetical protein M885DRAFT_520942 [Pelagophyceae sp. CCMP2097]|nr:hypothetical protein M885DRAFT_520942 [Pelagophyceae sp. CCMP2097]